jgi:hypothetical protein
MNCRIVFVNIAFLERNDPHRKYTVYLKTQRKENFEKMAFVVRHNKDPQE